MNRMTKKGRYIVLGLAGCICVIGLLAVVFTGSASSPDGGGIAGVEDNQSTRATSTVDGVTSATSVKPDRLRIPKIDVDADVQSVGVDSKGNMAAPSDWRDVSWYEPGFNPGELGNAVFSGHRDWDDNQAVFWDLKSLQVGDTVHIEGDGRLLTYTITGKERYDYQVSDTSGIFGGSDTAQIKLITCDGNFIDSSDTYQKRLVVTAQLQGATRRYSK